MNRRHLLSRSLGVAAALPALSLLAACGGDDDDDDDASGDTSVTVTSTQSPAVATEPPADAATPTATTTTESATATAPAAATPTTAATAPASASPTAADDDATPTSDEVGSVVTIDVLSTLASIHLGVTPLGAPELASGVYSAFVENFDDIADIGREVELDIEAILALAPDLVVGIDFGDGVVPNLQQTLTVATVPFGPYHWREHHLAVGAALGLQDLAAEQIAAAEARLAEIAAQVPDGTVLGVVSPSDGTVYVYTGWFPADILADCGFTFPGGLAFDPDAVDPVTFDGGIAAFAPESIGDLADADVFLVPGRGETLGAAVESFTTLPLADSLPAVQAGAVFEVGFDAWGYQGVMSVLQICNDIEEFVLPALEAQG